MTLPSSHRQHEFLRCEAFRRKRFRDRETDRLVLRVRFLWLPCGCYAGHNKNSGGTFYDCVFIGNLIYRTVIASFYWQFMLLSVDNNMISNGIVSDTVISSITFYNSRVDREIIASNTSHLHLCGRYLCYALI